MRLDEIAWANTSNEYWDYFCTKLPDGDELFIQRATPLNNVWKGWWVSLYGPMPESGRRLPKKEWGELDALTAQAVIYELTQGGNDAEV